MSDSKTSPASRPTHRIFLFDVDGTLSVARKEATPQMIKLLADLKSKAYIGMVGGSDLSKQIEQLGKNVLNMFDYVFSENGLVAFKDGKERERESIKRYLGDERIKNFVNFCLHYIADLDIPVKRGTFIEFRNGMINVSPVGRNCDQKERDEYEQYDLKHKIRETFVAKLQEKFGDYKLTFAIGGQISFDVFPHGWDKTYCLKMLEADKFTDIHFYGDKTSKGGNDYEIFTHPKVSGHTVKDPDDTIRQLTALMATL